MKCQSLRNWVMQCESMQVRTWPKKLVRHVKRCRPCRHFARSILRLEDRWKNQPLPDGAKKPSAAFLQQILEIENPPAEKSARETPRKRKRAVVPLRPLRWLGAAAAMLLIGVGALVFMLSTAGTSRAATSDVVERLIEWNLELTNADAQDRKRLLEENDPKFTAELAKAQLSEEERELAANLLEAARRIAASEDPDEEVEIINDLGAELKHRFERAEKKGNEKEYERCANFYAKFIAHDMKPFFERVKQMKPPERKDGFDKSWQDKGGDKKFGGFEKGMHDKGGKGGMDRGSFKSPVGKGPFGGGKGPFGFGKGPFGFGKGGFEKGDRDRDRERERDKGDRDKGERGMTREEYIQKQWDERLRAQEAWQKKGGMFLPPPFGKKK